jgi:hypothetical protein
MSEPTAHLALFDDVNPASEAIVRLREFGIFDKDMMVISGVPFSHKILGRPEKPSYVPLLGIIGALMGFGAGVALNFGTPLLYPMIVSSKPLLSVPTSLVVTFETTMLGLLIFTFLGVLLDSGLPSFSRKEYHPEISNGKIAIVFHCPPRYEAMAYEAMQKLGACEVRRAEAKAL